MTVCVSLAGIYKSKLETALLVAIPARDRLSPDRILPGRDSVFIVAQSDCKEGKILCKSDKSR